MKSGSKAELASCKTLAKKTTRTHRRALDVKGGKARASRPSQLNRRRLQISARPRSAAATYRRAEALSAVHVAPVRSRSRRRARVARARVPAFVESLAPGARAAGPPAPPSSRRDSQRRVATSDPGTASQSGRTRGGHGRFTRRVLAHRRLGGPPRLRQRARLAAPVAARSVLGLGRAAPRASAGSPRRASTGCPWAAPRLQ